MSRHERWHYFRAAIASVGVLAGCISPTDSESVKARNEAFLGTLEFDLDHGDSCRYRLQVRSGSARIFEYRGSETQRVTFAVDSAMEAFAWQDAQLDSVPVFISYTKDGPSWSHRAVAGMISAYRDSSGHWMVSATDLRFGDCSSDVIAFQNQPFYSY